METNLVHTPPAPGAAGEPRPWAGLAAAGASPSVTLQPLCGPGKPLPLSGLSFPLLNEEVVSVSIPGRREGTELLRNTDVPDPVSHRACRAAFLHLRFVLIFYFEKTVASQEVVKYNVLGGP